MMDYPLIAGFVKVRNEILRTGNIYRCIMNLQDMCDEIFVACDASYDGTDEYIRSIVPEDRILQVNPNEQDFCNELAVKQKLLDMIHASGPYGFILWQDGDEVMDAKGTTGIRDFCRSKLNTKFRAWAFHYLQLWRNSSWYRTDDSFNDGWFFKLWRYHPDLSFDIQKSTHHMQFPKQIQAAIYSGQTERAPFEVIHYGNYSKNLQWKCIQYSNGLGGVERHMNFEKATFKEMDKSLFPSGAEYNKEMENKPEPFNQQFKDRLLRLNNLTNLKKTFCIILPTNNRAYTLERAIDSILAQEYQDWILVVLDDASTDNTQELMLKYQEKDPRIFYARYLEHRGGVAMNEIGMDIAIKTCEWWTRMGSDDWWLPHKLKYDAMAFEKGHKALYGCFQVHREGKFQEVGNYPVSPDVMVPIFLKGGFFASWANVAVHCEILKKVKSIFGNYVDPRLINMEDLLFNYRVAELTPWIWRGKYDDHVFANPMPEAIEDLVKDKNKFKVDGYWNANMVGASASSDIYNKDQVLSTKLMNEDSKRFKK